MRRTLAALTLPLVLLAGCGGNDTKESRTQASTPAGTVEEWKAELASTGVVPPNWERYEALVRDDTCTNEDYGYYVALESDAGESLNKTRIGLKYACPERLADWDAAVVELGELADRSDYVCESPFDSLSAYDQHYALLVCEEYQTPEWEAYYNEHFPPSVEATLAP